MTGFAAMRVERIGEEAEPVVIIDGFAPDPAMFAEDAAFLGFRRIGEHYPGIRAEVPAAMIQPLLERLGTVIAQVFASDESTVIDAFYSLVTTPPSALAPIQRLPHVDGVEPGRLALLHYLSAEPSGGTAFYRHRSTGFETIDAGRLESYNRALAADIAREGLPDAAYIGADTALFEQTLAVAARYNRAILYRSHVLHCAVIAEGAALTTDPATGRFTVNTFLATTPRRA